MIATSIEQSYDLLAAGLSPESADMHYSSRKQEQDANGDWKIVLGDLVVGKPETENDLPAWSCSAMIDILAGNEITKVNYGVIDSSKSFCNSLVWQIEDWIKFGRINKKYLKKWKRIGRK